MDFPLPFSKTVKVDRHRKTRPSGVESSVPGAFSGGGGLRGAGAPRDLCVSCAAWEAQMGWGFAMILIVVYHINNMYIYIYTCNII